MVKRLTDAGDPTDRRAGIADTSEDFYKPTYWARYTDPLVRLNATGSSPIDGDVIRVPLGARPAAGSDHHMTIVQPDGWEYDLWNAQPISGGVLTYNAGRKIPIDGDGLNSAATSARFGNLAGRLRAQELEDGQINHAFFMAASTTATTAVYPADKSDGNNDPAAGYPPMGTRFQLPDHRCGAGSLPALEAEPILRAFRDYGGYLRRHNGVALDLPGAGVGLVVHELRPRGPHGHVRAPGDAGRPGRNLIQRRRLLHGRELGRRLGESLTRDRALRHRATC